MRKLHTLIALLLTSWCSRAQQIPLEDFFEPGATWCSWEEDLFTNPGGPVVFKYLQFSIGSDTIMNGRTYHSLFLSTRSTNGAGQNIHTPIVIAGIRVQNDSVFLLPVNTIPVYTTERLGTHYNKLPLNVEHLLYNYRLAIGDIISYKSSPDYKVTSINTFTQPSGIQLEIIDLQHTLQNYSTYWIKGIGAKDGFMFSVEHELDFTQLLYYKNSKLEYSFTPMASSQIQGDICFPVNVTEVKNSQRLYIYPNPCTTEIITIENTEAINQVILFDITGKQLSSTQEMKSGRHNLQVPQQTGVYILKAQFADGTTVTKKLSRQ